jgi:hypothetical protein
MKPIPRPGARAPGRLGEQRRRAAAKAACGMLLLWLVIALPIGRALFD